MNIGRRALGIVVALLAAVGVARSDGDSDLRAVIAKAIKARGPAASEAKYMGLEMKGTGTYYGLGEGIPFTGDWHIKGKSKTRYSLEIKVMDQTLTITQVLNGDKGWKKINDTAMPLEGAELAEEKAEQFAKWVTTLTPLKDKAFKLAALGEVKIGDRAATGIRVSHAGQRDVNLFIDNANHLLVKTEHQVKDAKGGNDTEMAQESYYSTFKEANGFKFPTKIEIKRDGKRYVEAEINDYLPLENVDDSLFAQP